MSHPILLYDGVCGLCNRFVRFILRRDRNALFRLPRCKALSPRPSLPATAPTPAIWTRSMWQSTPTFQTNI